MPRKTRKEIDDPVFGRLTFDIIWEGRIEIEPFGVIQVTVDGGNEGKPPSDVQRAAVADLQSRTADLHMQILGAVFSHYCSHRDQYLALAVNPDHDVPGLSSAEEITTVLKGRPRLSVACHRLGEPPTLKLRWNSTFDDEHGITVYLVDGMVREVGP